MMGILETAKKEARKLGRKEGRQEGLREVIREREKEVALEMLKDDYPIEKVMKYCRLTREEVMQLKQRIDS